MRTLAKLSLPGYAMCLWLLFFPLLDTFVLAFPPAPTDVEWRYSFVEVLSRSLMTPMLGTFGLLLIASTSEHDVVRRLVGFIAALAAVLLVVVLAVFLLDSIRLGDGVRAGMAAVFGGPWFAAIGKLILASVLLSLVARGAQRPPAEEEGREEKAKRKGTKPLAVKG